jgi:hypothetical protein
MGAYHKSIVPGARVASPNPKLSDPAHKSVRMHPERDGRVRCGAYGLGVVVVVIGAAMRLREVRGCPRCAMRAG